MRLPPRDGAAGTLFWGTVAGFAGTAAMTAATVGLERLHPEMKPVDYDASDAPWKAAAKVLHVTPRRRWQRRALFHLVHWGYGSFVGSARYALDRGDRAPMRTDAAYFAGLQTMAFALLPVLGDTPPPWRWHRHMAAHSLELHAVYAWTTGWAARRLRGRATAG